jgi:putative transposase
MTRLFRNRYRADTIRLRGYDYRTPGWFFITICTKDRKPVFGDIRNGIMGLNEVGCLAKSCWDAVPDHHPYVDLGSFVVMPNHVHGLIALLPDNDTVSPPDDARSSVHPPHPPSRSLGIVVRSYKAAVTRLVRKTDCSFAWQARYHDRIVRNGAEFEAIHVYITENPGRWMEDRLLRPATTSR